MRTGFCSCDSKSAAENSRTRHSPEVPSPESRLWRKGRGTHCVDAGSVNEAAIELLMVWRLPPLPDPGSNPEAESSISFTFDFLLIDSKVVFQVQMGS
jgi:hypothetical protein